MPKLITMKSVASPILLSGAGYVANMSGTSFFIQGFGEFEKVKNVMATIDSYTISGFEVRIKPSVVSGNAVRVDVQKTQALSGFASLGSSGYCAAVSGDLISNTVTILAEGE